MFELIIKENWDALTLRMILWSGVVAGTLSAIFIIRRKL